THVGKLRREGAHGRQRGGVILAEVNWATRQRGHCASCGRVDDRSVTMRIDIKALRARASVGIVLALLFGSPGGRTAVAAELPSMVLMLADNLGYGELGCYGGGILRGAPTPRIDRLAREGLRLLNYNVEAQCTPSRSALMTGRFSIRSGTMRVNRGGALYGFTDWVINRAEPLCRHE